MSLYQKYRPATFGEVKGNVKIIQTLTTMVADKETCPHAFLLYGQTGCGKTTLARIIATELGCKGIDFREINTANNRGIDTARDIINAAQYMPIESDCQVFLIDEVHKVTGDAQNALLKILEDTPPHVYFILCTTDPQKVITAVKGRCSQFQVLPLDDTQMFGLLRGIARKENDKLEQEVADQIILSAKGLPRNALVILEQVLKAPVEDRLETAKKAEAEENEAKELCKALLSKASWSKISTILKGLQDQDAERIRRCVIGYCQAVLLNGKAEDRCGVILGEFINPFYDSGFPQLTYACFVVFNTK